MQIIRFLLCRSAHLFQSDLIGDILRRVEDLDGSFVVEDVALGGRQNFEDPSLDVVQLTLVVRGLDYEGIPLVFQLGPFSRHHDAQQLVLETFLCYHEVQQRHLHAHRMLLETSPAQKHEK